jgi:hypothetical protein
MQNFLTSRKKASGESRPKESYTSSAENPQLSNIEVVHAAANEPKVELVNENGVVRTIVITCKCGERIELKCHY